MTKINNLTLKKELKRNNKFLFMALIFLFLGLLLITYAIYQNFRKENYIYLNNVIEEKNNEENVNAYLTVTKAPYSIAKYEGDLDAAFYIIFDGRYFYIAYISDDIYKELEKDPQEIYGITTKIPESLKDIAIKVYNTGLDEEEQIDIESFNSYFGEVYLNNVTLIQVNKTVFILSIIPLILSILFLIIFITTKLKTKKELNKIDLQKLSEENLYYNKDKHFLLTKQYLIINQKKLNIIPLNNIIKIYEKDIKGFNTIIEKQLWITNKNNQEMKIISFAQPNLKEIKKIINLICRENKKIINENNEA